MVIPWLTTFIRIALKDVHIACPLAAEDYLRLIREHTPSEVDDAFLLPGASKFANNSCRSLTFHVDHDSDLVATPEVEPSVLLYSTDNRSANAISSTLYMVSTLNYLPNLRRVAIEYVDWGFEDIPEQGRLLVFPEQVTELDIKFTFTADSLTALGDRLRNRYCRRWHVGGTTQNVRRLSVFGAPVDFVAEMIWTCPNVEIVDFDGAEDLDALLALPDSLRMLNLHMPASPLRKEDIDKLGLPVALGLGLFSQAHSQMRIVVHSGTPEATPWEQAKKLCEEFKVELVHRPYIAEWIRVP